MTDLVWLRKPSSRVSCSVAPLLYPRSMALYRTYRPSSFDDVAGQEQVIATLRHAAEQDKLAHAYLFAGTRGTGKTSTARIVAKHLLTKGITDDTVASHIRKAVDDGSLVDLVEIDAASNTSVDHVRDLIEKIQFSPLVASAKVYIIDEVHMLSKSAFNALLKTLEEPPPYAYFILATTELQKIPATIQSRCQRFLFRPIADADIVSRLRYIAQQENIDAEDEALEAIARYAGGGMRDAVSLLDQLRTEGNITLQTVRERLGETSHALASHMLSAMENGDAEAVSLHARELETNGSPPEVFIRLMLSALRERLHQQASSGQDTSATLKRIALLLQAAKDCRSSPLPGLTLESMLLAGCAPKQTTNPASPAALQSTAQPTPAPVPAPQAETTPAPPAPTPQSPPASPVHTEPPKASASEPPAAPVKTPDPAVRMSLESLQKEWPTIVSAVESAAAKMSLKNARLHDLAGDLLILSFDSSFHRDKVAQQSNAHAIESLLRQRTGAPLRLKCIVEGELFHRPKTQGTEDNVAVADAVSDIF